MSKKQFYVYTIYVDGVVRYIGKGSNGRVHFCGIRPFTAIFVSNHPQDSIAYSGIPYATEQGISKGASGKIFQGTGNLHPHVPTLPQRKLGVGFAALKLHPPR